jgi:pyrimidine oxygenase
MQDFWSTGESNFKGKYFQMNDAQCLPTPPTRNIPLVCAGMSERGMRFTAEIGRYSFVTTPPDRLPELRRRLDDAAASAGRVVGMLPNFIIFQAPTDDEAQERYRAVVAAVDMEAVENLRRDAGAGTGATAEAFVESERTMFAATATLVGSYDTIARTLRQLEENRVVDGCLFVFLDYLADMLEFAEHVLPRLDATTGARALADA